MDTVSPGRIIVFSAASGAGKTTLLNHVKNSVDRCVYSISATTRKPRGGEVDGVHYFFLTHEEFQEKIARNEFAEWEKVHNNFYGTPRSFIDETVARGDNVLMDIDVYGKKKFDTVYPEAVGIFVMPPSLAELERRLRGRGEDDARTIALRLENAEKEIAFARSAGKYEHTIVNDDLARARTEAVALVKSIIEPR